jgi:3-deoxy-manno-octulosonate cytidylyltransferase (CMP-KDO synthetase)
MTEFVIVIPVRLASERLPGKPLVDIAGRTMIERVYRQAVASEAGEVIIATDSSEIEAAMTPLGARVEMTSREHGSGTDRIAEVAARAGWGDDRIVVNVQGDEPLIPPAIIDQVAGLLAADPAASIATLMTPLLEASEYANPNMVKVVVDRDGRAIYFSRAPIPHSRGGGMPADARRHIGLYAYRVAALRQLAATEPAPPERVERLEQLRALWLGLKIAIADASEIPPRGVDTAEDLEIIREIVRQRN